MRKKIEGRWWTDQRIKAVMTAILQQCMEEEGLSMDLEIQFFSRLGTEKTSAAYEDQPENSYVLVQGFPRLFPMALSFPVCSYLVQLFPAFLLCSWLLPKLGRGHWITDNLGKSVWSLFSFPGNLSCALISEKTFVEYLKRQFAVYFLCV